METGWGQQGPFLFKESHGIEMPEAVCLFWFNDISIYDITYYHMRLLTLYLHVLNLRYSTVQWCSNFYELLDSLPGEWYRNLAVSLNHESLALWPWMSKQTPSTCSFLSQLLSQIILQILRLILPEVQLLTWRISLAVSRFLSRRPNRPGDLAIIHCLRSLCEIWREGSHVPSPY